MARAGSAAQRAAPSTALPLRAANFCARQHSASSAAAHANTPGENHPHRTLPSAAATAAPTSSVPMPGRSGANLRSPKPMPAASRASAALYSKRSAPPLLPSAKHSAMPVNVPQPASAAGTNFCGSSQRAATAAPSAHS